MRRSLLKGFVDGCAQLITAVGIEHLEQKVDRSGEMSLPLREDGEHFSRSRHGTSKAILAAVDTGMSLGLPEGIDVVRILDGLIFTP